MPSLLFSILFLVAFLLCIAVTIWGYPSKVDIYRIGIGFVFGLLVLGLVKMVWADWFSCSVMLFTILLSWWAIRHNPSGTGPK